MQPRQEDATIFEVGKTFIITFFLEIFLFDYFLVPWKVSDVVLSHSFPFHWETSIFLNILVQFRRIYNSSREQKMGQAKKLLISFSISVDCGGFELIDVS